MPAFFTHYLGGDKMLSLTNKKLVKDPINRHRHLFNLGTQGPDLFFFHRAWPWTKKDSLSEIGEMLHVRQVSELFAGYLDYIIHETGEVKEMLSSYLYGFTCHYAVDLHTHPYIYYKTGFTRKGEAATKKFTVNHHKFETALDVLMLDLNLGVKPYPVNGPRLIDISRREAEALGKMYETILPDVLGVKASSHQIVTGIQDMRRILAALRDRSGLKKKVLAFTENLLGKPQLISSLIYPAKVSDGLDYLNKKHQPWSLPWDGKIQLTDSFLQLFDRACQEAAEMCEAISLCLAGSIDKDKALAKIGNRSFSTGQDCASGVTFQVYDCIFP